ncbi:MAG: sulfite exporter TauE/SafE family protein [Eubacteriales bacterium]|nr:sulfite exporter TauE/SafE family protein [Eubacteriales bacterium]
MDKLQKSERFGVVKKILIIITSLFAGFATGVFGGGGGMIIVPILTGLYGLQPTKAHATAIATIFPLCLVSVIFYLTHGGWEWKSGLVVSAGVVVGGIVGALAMKKIPANWLQPIFYILMIVGGIKMLAQ